ncbi:MAG: hypothetical protein D3910_22355 [Candidatus Electrothrix sp. ATG2]|nr:hypothetical protein [Candidatus Electrothrix sp. ATG2]
MVDIRCGMAKTQDVEGMTSVMWVVWGGELGMEDGVDIPSLDKHSLMKAEFDGCFFSLLEIPSLLRQVAT